MAQHHGYSVTEIENMIPYELEIYSNLLIEYLDKKNEEKKAAKSR